MCATIDFEYIRHGTTSRIGFFDVTLGTIYPPYLNKTRTENDFCQTVQTILEANPKGQWGFVCDGLTTHKSESLVRLIAEFCDLDIPLGIKGKYGILHNKKTREAFLHDSDHRIRFVYTPKHSSWMNQIEIWLDGSSV